MKILQVIPFFTPKHGGSVKSTYYLASKLNSRGNEVTIVTSDFEFDEKYAATIEKDGVRVIAFNCIANICSFYISPSMKRWLNNNIYKFDIIHIHNFRSYQNNLISYYANKYRIPYILQARGSVLPHFQKQHLKKIYDYMWGYKLLSGASKVIALNLMEKEQYIQMGVDESKIEIIPNGIDLNNYQELPIRGQFRDKYNIGQNEKMILSLGRLHKIKGLDLLIEAFSLVEKELEDVKLVIAGPDYGELPILKKQIDEFKINDKIVFTGPLYGADKTAAYVDADIYVLPSRYEVFGNTILESYACGTPVIVTDRCGISDFVKNVGCVVNFDRNELRDAIIVLLKDNDLRERFGREGKELVKKQFDLNEIVACFEKVYSSCI